VLRNFTEECSFTEFAFSEECFILFQEELSMKPFPTPVKNRRRSARRSTRRTTKVDCHGPMGLGPNLALKILDVSETGVRLILKREFPIGSEVEVSLEGTSNRRAIRRVAEVIWSVPTQDGNYCVGVAFRKPLQFMELHQM
jgi:hypothetical protein